jgi:cyclophilin family peptidyl-prolyl cis-trans isomerase
MKWSNISWALAALLIVSSCSKKLENTDQVVSISTRLGNFKFILFDDTPRHKASFVELAKAGAYDSTLFYRVMKGFMVQGGNVGLHPEYEKLSRRLIPSEISSKHIHTRGMVGAARQSVNRNPNKKSSTQFYIVQGKKFSEREVTTKVGRLNNALPKYLYDGQHQDLIDEFKILQDSGRVNELQQRILALRDEMEKALEMSFENTEISQSQIKAYTTIGGAPHLDGDYTVFGKVVEGMATIDKIAALEVDSVDNPLEPVYMQVRIEDVPKDSITAWYGIIYPKVKTEEKN